MIADYAVILTIIMFVAFDNYYGLATPKLIVPTIFKVCSMYHPIKSIYFPHSYHQTSYWFGFTRSLKVTIFSPLALTFVTG